MKLGYAIMTALDETKVSPAHTAARVMIEALITPYLSHDEFLQSVANFGSWHFTFAFLPCEPAAPSPQGELADDIPF